MTHDGNANATDSSGAVIPFQFDDISVSWAGEGRRESEFCVGTEDGQLRFTTVDGEIIGGFSNPVHGSESVNGVAFVGPVIAISNRRDVAFWTPVAGQNVPADCVVLPFGAHGVVATGSGYFVAPIGRTGLAKVRIDREAQQRIVVSHVPQQSMDYYKVVELHSNGRRSVLVCAMRFAGIAAAELLPDGETPKIWSLTFPGLDVVDVCALSTEPNQRAVAAIDRRGALVLLRDVFSDVSPAALDFDGITGTAYRVFCAQGNVLILTSTGLHVLCGLGRRFLEGESVDNTPTTVRTFHLEAVDANLCWHRWLLMVTPDGVLRFDTKLLTGGLPVEKSFQAETRSSPTPISPTWEFHQGIMTVST